MTQNKKVLITGASGGLGRAITAKLQKEEYELYLHSHKSKEGFLTADLSREEGIERLLAETGTDIDVFIHSNFISLTELLHLKNQEPFLVDDLL